MKSYYLLAGILLKNSIRSTCQLNKSNWRPMYSWRGQQAFWFDSRSYLRISKRNINISYEDKAGTRTRLLQRKRSPFGYLFVLLPIATFCLGTWQVFRLRWKLNLIEKLEKIISGSPIDFPENLENLKQMEYVKVKVSGYFDLSAEPIMVFPRTLLNQVDKKQQGSSLISSSNARNIGAHLIMPFVITDGRLVNAFNEQTGKNQNTFRILVNLGWISRETMDKLKTKLSCIDKIEIDPKGFDNQSIELVGVIRHTEKREPFRQKSNFNHGHWNRRDLEKMSQVLNTESIFLDCQQSFTIQLLNSINVAPTGAQTKVNLRNEHFSYILTWYSLSGIFSYLWYSKIFKPRL